MKALKFLSCLLAVQLLLNFPITAKEFPNTPQMLSTDFTQVAKKAIPAVVSIRVELKTGLPDSEDSELDLFGSDDFFRRFFRMPRGDQNVREVGQGSGFLVTPTGYILTNNHIVKNADKIEVKLVDGREFYGKVIGQDPNTDLAIVKIEGNDFPFLTLGNSNELEVGQWVAAIGNSLGLQATLTVGVVSAKDRNNLGLAQVEDFIQTDAAINRGNSGGPLLNLSGEVVGINTAIVSNSGGNMGIGFAIPSALVQHVMDQILKDGSVTRGYIGVLMQNVDNDLAQAFGLNKPQGVLVAEVAKDSPAEKAGLKAGDIVLKNNGNTITNLGALRNAIAMMKPGTELKLEVLRDKKTLSMIVKIDKFPESEVAVVSESNSKLGIQVESLTQELRQSLGYSSDEKGVVVIKVDANSLASLAGIKKGSLIVEVNKQKVNTPDEFNKAVQATEAARPYLLLMKQGSVTRFVSIKGQ